MRLDRRLFLGSLGLGALGALAWRFSSLTSSGRHVLVGGNVKEMIRFDLSNGETSRVMTNGASHSFMPWSPRRNCYLGIEKSGSVLSVVDFESGRLLRTIIAPKDRVFYGHGVLVPSGENYIFSQVDGKTGLGYLVFYDVETLEPKDEIQATVGGVHEVALTNRGELAFTSSGARHKYEGGGLKPADGIRVEPSSLIYYDLSNRHPLEKHELTDPSQIVGHFKIIDETRAVIVTTIFEGYKGSSPAKAGSIWISERNRGLREMIIPPDVRSRMDYELLSVDVSPDRRWIAATNPRGREIMIFDARSEKFVSSRRNSSNGIAWADDDRTLIVSGMSADDDRSEPLRDLRESAGFVSSHFLLERGT